MKYLISISLSVLLFVSLSCQPDSQLTNTQRKTIVEDVKKMTEQFFIDSDAKNIDAIINYLDTSSTFIWIFPPDSTYITRDQLAAGLRYKLSSDNQVISKWDKMRIEPLTPESVYYQGVFHQNVTDTLGKQSNYVGIESAVIVLKGDGWKFLSGQTYYALDQLK